MKKDIENRDDLFLLMQTFYRRLLADETVSYLFTDVAKIDLDHHLPVLVDFWDMVLFQSDTYRKNAIQLHMILHQKSPLKPEHFQTWLSYFSETVDELFEGQKATEAKKRARSIASIMQIKIAQFKSPA
jgi:hemoglobin